MIDDIYLTPKDVSKILKLGINRTYALFKVKGFPYVRFGNSYRVGREDLFKFLSNHHGITLPV